MEFTGKLKEELLKCECREEAKKKLEDAGLLLNDEELDAVVGGGGPFVNVKGQTFEEWQKNPKKDTVFV